MEYTLTETEKRFHRNFLWQCWRFACLSMKFRKLLRQGGYRAPEKAAELRKGARYEDGMVVPDDPPVTQEKQRKAA
jgi:hypothetical protein